MTGQKPIKQHDRAFREDPPVSQMDGDGMTLLKTSAYLCLSVVVVDVLCMLCHVIVVRIA